jgi:putative glutamine amidotransferase
VSRPLIVIAGRWSGQIDGLKRPGVFAPITVLDAVSRAGGEVVMAWPDSDERAAELLARADGVVLPGGNDMDLRPFGVPDVHPLEVHPVPEQDTCDITIARAAVAAGLPTLAICRGMQVLNVIMGGTIHQHREETTVPHRSAVHDIAFTGGSLLAKVIGADTAPGFSNHHQACDRLADGLVLSGATADDCVEGFESEDGRLLGVQWHPELDAATAPRQQALFDWLVEAARG